MTTSSPDLPKDMREWIGRCLARQETLHARLKFFNILSHRFRHGKSPKERMNMHKMAVEAGTRCCHCGIYCFIQFVQLSTTILSMATLLLIRTNNVEEFLAMRLYQWSSATSISLRIAEDVCQRKMINQDQ